MDKMSLDRCHRHYIEASSKPVSEKDIVADFFDTSIPDVRNVMKNKDSVPGENRFLYQLIFLIGLEPKSLPRAMPNHVKHDIAEHFYMSSPLGFEESSKILQMRIA